MKKILFIFVLLATFFILPSNINAAELKDVDIYLFYSDTCPHCAEEKIYLNKLIKEKQNVKLHLFEVTKNKENDLMFDKILKGKELDIDSKKVPFTMIGTKHFIGFGSDTKFQIERAVREYSKIEYNDDYKIIIKGEKRKNIEDLSDSSSVKLPFLGEVKLNRVSLPLVAVIIGVVDGFNPCAMWVLIFLMSMLIGMKNRKRMWIIGLTFLLTSALVYMFIMLAWLNISVSFIQIRFVQTIIGLIALAGATFSLNSYLKSLKEADGCNVTDQKQRKKILEKIKKFTTQKSLFLALIGVITLAVSVNIIELACSTGLPVLFTTILAANDLSSFQYGFYIALYILFFLIDDLIIFAIAMSTLKISGISTKYTKYSHLIGGVIMFIFGIIILIKPEWLSFNF